MKKIILSIIGAMLISAGGVYAQQEEPAGTASKSKARQQRQGTEQTRQQPDQTQQQRDQTDGNKSWQQQTDRSQYGDSYANEGMVVIEKEQIPASLKKTLKEQKYAGWENATIYHNTTTGEYVIAPRAYRFDSEGKEMEMADAERSGYGQGRSGRYSPGNRSENNQQQSQNQSSDYNRSRNQTSDQSTSDTESTTNDESAISDQSTGQQTQDPSSQDQTDNTSTTPGNQQPSSGYRSGQDTQSDTTRNNTRQQSQSTSGQTNRDQ